MILAELGSTHDGSLGNALRAIRVAKSSGADAVKLQDHRWQTLRLDQPHPSPYVTELRKAYYERTAFTEEQWEGIRDEAHAQGLKLVVSVFSEEAAQEQEHVADMLKVASGEVGNVPLLEACVRTGRPVILSSGMSGWAELDRAVDVLGKSLHSVLHCVSEYPTPPERWGLRAGIPELQARYPTAVVGYSDHTEGVLAPALAAWLGASVFELHFTLSRKLYGSDAWHSREPEEFAAAVEAIQQARVARTCRCPREERVRWPAVEASREGFAS